MPRIPYGLSCPLIQLISFYLISLRSCLLKPTAFPTPCSVMHWKWYLTVSSLQKKQSCQKLAARPSQAQSEPAPQKCLLNYSPGLLVCPVTALELFAISMCSNSKMSSEVQARQLLLDNRWRCWQQHPLLLWVTVKAMLLEYLHRSLLLCIFF